MVLVPFNRSVDRISRDVAGDGAGQPVPVEELLRCAVRAWGELLRHEGLRCRASDGFDQVCQRMAQALRRGQAAGTVPSTLDPDRGTRVVMALPHGFVLQRTAFGLDDADGFTEHVRTVLTEAGVLSAT